jgi:hypothetical protein
LDSPEKLALIAELQQVGIKHDPEKILRISRLLDGQIVFLEEVSVQRLEAWARANDAQLNWDEPANSGEPTEEEIEEFEREGISLWQKLQQELSPNYEVVYFSERRRKVVTDLSELSPKDLVAVS